MSLTSLSGILPGSTGAVQAMLANGTAGGTLLNQSMNYTFADDLLAAGSQFQPRHGGDQRHRPGLFGPNGLERRGRRLILGQRRQLERHQGPSPTSVHAAPGLDSNFTAVDTATFDNSTGTGGTVNLNSANPSLSGINFSGTDSYTLAQGSGGALTLQYGGGVATISVTGNQTISAPINLSTNAALARPAAATS